MKATLVGALSALVATASCRGLDTRTPEYRAAEQEVVRSLLTAEYVNAVQPSATSEIVLRDHFECQDSLSVERAAEWLRDSIPDVPANVVARFRELQRETTAIPAFSLPRASLYLMSDSSTARIFARVPRDTMGWAMFRTEHPRAGGIITVSRAALSNDGSWALIYAGNQSGWLSGEGYLYVLRKDGPAWRSVKRLMIWVS